MLHSIGKRLILLAMAFVISALHAPAARATPWPRELGGANLPFKWWYGASPQTERDGQTLFQTQPFNTSALRRLFPSDWQYFPTTHAMHNNPDLRNYYDPHFVVIACAPEGCAHGRRAAVLTWVSPLFSPTVYVLRTCAFDAGAESDGAIWTQQPIDPRLLNDRRRPTTGVFWRNPSRQVFAQSSSFECRADAVALVAEMYRAYNGEGVQYSTNPLRESIERE